MRNKNKDKYTCVEDEIKQSAEVREGAWSVLWAGTGSDSASFLTAGVLSSGEEESFSFFSWTSSV